MKFLFKLIFLALIVNCANAKDTIDWKQHLKPKNCWQSNGGADKDLPTFVQLTFDGCKTKCQQETECNCITYRASEKRCWLRKNCHIAKCTNQNGFEVAYGNRKEPEKILFVGEGRCPEEHQTGEQKEAQSKEECGKRCFDNFHETYFSMTNDKKCTCYKDCDTRDNDAAVKTYEVLSKHVSELLFKNKMDAKNLAIDLQTCNTNLDTTKGSLTICNTNLDTTKGTLKTCQSNLNDMEDKKDLWKTRFAEVKNLEKAGTLTAMAEKKHKGEGVAVGQSHEKETALASTSNMAKFIYISFGTGMVFGAIMMKVISKTKKLSEQNPLLETL